MLGPKQACHARRLFVTRPQRGEGDGRITVGGDNVETIASLENELPLIAVHTRDPFAVRNLL